MQPLFRLVGLFIFGLAIFSINTAEAQIFDGEFSFGFAGGITATDQGDINELQSRANARSTVSAGQLGNAWEVAGIFQYRYKGSFLALQIRPGFFYQSEDGSDSSGIDHEYGVSGYTIFPTARFHMLESDVMKFYSQFGLGYGYASGTIKEADSAGTGTAEVEFSGGDIGWQVGLGAEFCFLGGAHCVLIEGNYRFLEIDRVTADKQSGTFASDSISQPTGGGKGEVEYDDKDLSVDLSGIQGLIGYIFHFK